MPKETASPARKRTLEWSEVGSEVIILDRALGELLRLNAVAGFIWKQLDGKRTVEEIAESMLEHFATDARVAARDVRKFLRQLSSLELVEAPEGLRSNLLHG